MKYITSQDLRLVPAFKVQPGQKATTTKRLFLLAVLFWGALWGAVSTVHAGGGGENMLLIVNPTDEPSLRIANAYVKARNIPINNILYIDPTNGKGATTGITSGTFYNSFQSLYQNAVPNAIAARGLTNQIDYIGTLGQPHLISSSSPSYAVGFHDCLNHLTQLQNGMTPNQVVGRYSELLQYPPNYNSPTYSYPRGSNPAIHHSQQLVALSGSIPYVQWYMTGVIGYSGLRGLTTSQAIQNLQRTVKGDGTKPFGTVYFEDSQEVRTTTRSPYWPAIQSYMDDLGIPWIQELGITPKNRSDVRGAVVGSSWPGISTQFVNGSAYLPGSWADDLTSSAGAYSDGSQTKVSNFLLGGAGATAGSLIEPYAVQQRFTYASVFLFSNDGSTLGEAFYKSIQQPDYLMLQGDLLSQAYADVPEVQFTGGPTDGASVSGIISISGSARLNNPSVATGIAQLKLFVDGLPSGPVVSGSVGSFNVDTTTLTDGVHEVRIVAYNNSQAASEGYALENVVVNNKSQSVSITGTSSYNVAWNQILSIPVVASQGTGPAITGIQLQSLGRVVGSISGLSGNVSLDVTKLAYGSNTITPVAVLSSSTQRLQGTPITVTRQFQQFPGTAPTPLAKRNPGCDFYFFGNAVGTGSNTLDTINFNATPSYTLHSTTLSINVSVNDTNPAIRNMPEQYHSGSYYAAKLAIMIKSNFTVATAGEYLLVPECRSYSSSCLILDGTMITRKDVYSWSSAANAYVWAIVDPPRSVYLLPGEHTLTIKLAQGSSYIDGYSAGFAFSIRGPDGNTISGSAPTFYTVTKRVSP